MNRIVLVAAAAASLAAVAATTSFAHDRRAVITAPGPVAQGHPHLVRQGGVTVIYPVPQRPLQFALIDGRRVLIDPSTLDVVYRLHP